MEGWFEVEGVDVVPVASFAEVHVGLGRIVVADPGRKRIQAGQMVQGACCDGILGGSWWEDNVVDGVDVALAEGSS